MSKIWSKIKNWFNPPDALEVLWAKRGFKVVKTRIEFDNGLVRELEGEASDNWHKDHYRASWGRKVDWTKHKWKESKIIP